MAGAGVGGLLLPPAANRAVVAMTMSPRLHLPTATSKPIRRVYRFLRRIVRSCYSDAQIAPYKI